MIKLTTKITIIMIIMMGNISNNLMITLMLLKIIKINTNIVITLVMMIMIYLNQINSKVKLKCYHYK